MKLSQVCEDKLPNAFDKSDVNSLSKKPKKLKKGVYGVGGGPVGIGHSSGCTSNGGGGASAGTGGGSAGGAAGGGAGGAGGGGGA